jgi:hypothetical protein
MAFYDLAVAKVPNAKEFAAQYCRMDPVTRSRLERLAWRGQQGSNPNKAALLVAFTERGLRQLRWTVTLSAPLAALSLLSAALTTDSAVRWMSLWTRGDAIRNPTFRTPIRRLHELMINARTRELSKREDNTRS